MPVCHSLSITTLVSLLVNEFDVRSVLHGQVSLLAVNQIYVSHEAILISTLIAGSQSTGGQ